MKFKEYLKNNKNIDIYFDMDGVFAEYDIGNFDYNTIRPIKSVIKLMKELIDDNINVKILSICKNNKIVEEKYNWLKKYQSLHGGLRKCRKKVYRRLLWGDCQGI